MKFELLVTIQMLFFAFKVSDVVFILLINVKMPTIIVILTFKSMINSCSVVEHEKVL